MEHENDNAKEETNAEHDGAAEEAKKLEGQADEEKESELGDSDTELVLGDAGQAFGKGDGEVQSNSKDGQEERETKPNDDVVHSPIESDGYISTSTIDSAPRGSYKDDEDEDDRQQVIPGTEVKEEVKGDHAEKYLTDKAKEIFFVIDVTIKLTPQSPGASGRPITIPIVHTVAANWRVLGILAKCFTGRKIVSMLTAILDIPESFLGRQVVERNGEISVIAGPGTVSNPTVQFSPENEPVGLKNPLTGVITPIQKEGEDSDSEKVEGEADTPSNDDSEKPVLGEVRHEELTHDSTF